MKLLLDEIRHNRLLWLLAFVPGLFIAHRLAPESHTLLFGLSVLAILLPIVALVVMIGLVIAVVVLFRRRRGRAEPA